MRTAVDSRAAAASAPTSVIDERTEPVPAAGQVGGISRHQSEQQRDLDARDEPVRAERFPVGLEDA